jgi:hypothetical protein
MTGPPTIARLRSGPHLGPRGVLTVTRDRPAVVALDPAGTTLERIEP